MIEDIREQDASIPDSWKDGLDAEFISEIEGQPETAEDSVKSEVEPLADDKQEEVKEPDKQPDYKQMYENMQRALKEEREKNDKRLKELEERIKPATVETDADDDIEQKAIDNVVKSLKAKGEDYNDWDPAHQRKVAREMARLASDKAVEKVKEIEVKRETETIQQQFQKAYQEIFSDVDPQELDNYAMNKLKTLPLEEGFSIAKALELVNQGQVTREVIDVLKPYYSKVKSEFKTAKTQKAQKVEQITNLPRASQIKGGGSPTEVDNIEDMYAKWDSLTPKQQEELARLAFKYKE